MSHIDNVIFHIGSVIFWVRLILGTPRTLRGPHPNFSSFCRIKIV